MTEEAASNYPTGKTGKAPIIPMGQTSGVYGNEPHIATRNRGATDLTKK